MLCRRTVRLGGRGRAGLTDSRTVRGAAPLDRGGGTLRNSCGRNPWRDYRSFATGPATGLTPRPAVRHRLRQATGRRDRTRLGGGSTDGGEGAGGGTTPCGDTGRCAVGVRRLGGVGRERVAKLAGDRCLHR